MVQKTWREITQQKHLCSEKDKVYNDNMISRHLWTYFGFFASHQSEMWFKLSFPLIVFGFGTKPSTLTLVLLPPLDLSISMLYPSPPGLYYSLEGGILLLTALHLFDSFSLLSKTIKTSYSRSVCSWGFTLEYYVENHWIKLSDCRNEPSRWFLCFTI